MNVHTPLPSAQPESSGPSLDWLIAAPAARLRPRRSGRIAAAGVGGALLAVAAIWGGAHERSAPAPRPAAAKPPSDPVPLRRELDAPFAPESLRPLTSIDARGWNASVPIATLPNPAARAFLQEVASESDAQRSLACLTAAIYYEAGNEPINGQRAVAQVVLNRVRHPIFPHSVCGVVFQGSDRSTGCQFTFTCDGSLARRPEPVHWARVMAVAQAALHGYVYTPVGWATHYHADYVVPYWAAKMVKLWVIGAHIFYRLDGPLGTGKAFTAGYAGAEPGAPGLIDGDALTVAAMVPTARAEIPEVERPILLNTAPRVATAPVAAVAGVSPLVGGARWVIGGPTGLGTPVPSAERTPLPARPPTAPTN